MDWSAIVSKRCKGSSWLGVEKESFARFVFSSKDNSTTQCDFRGVSILPLTKISIANLKTQIKSPSKNEFLWFILSVILVAFFWNFGLHVYRTLSVEFTAQKFPYHGMCHRSPMQWRPSNRKLSVCFTGNEINKANSNVNIDCWTREFILFCDTFEFGAVFCRLSREGLHL